MIKFVKNLLGCLILITLPIFAYSANWIELSNNQTNTIYFDDSSVITKSDLIYSKSFIGSWFKFDYKKANNNISSEKFMIWFHCKDKTVSNTPSEYYAYDKNGKVIDSDNKDFSLLKFNNIPPDTVVEGMYDTICLHKLLNEISKANNTKDPKLKKVQMDIIKDTYFRQINLLRTYNKETKSQSTQRFLTDEEIRQKLPHIDHPANKQQNTLPELPQYQEIDLN